MRSRFHAWLMLCGFGLAALSISGAAHALPLNDRDPAVQPAPGPSSETPLATILGDLADPDIDVLDQSEFAFFGPANGVPVASLIIELAGFANDNEFGIFAPLDESGTPGPMAVIFPGSAGPGATATLSFNADDSITVTLDTGGLLDTWDVPNFGDRFGLFLTTPQDNTFYSLDALNPDGGAAHALLYQGSGENIGDLSDGTLGPNDFVVAWEDLAFPLSGNEPDYNDGVLLVENVVGVPEPATVILFGMGAAGLAVFGSTHRARRPHAS